ncbi:helix-turn-helix transcriptional regulator [Kaistella sp.]|uniref:helix-turn-helix transcriptional regulator n=1 Tax=Kaistella sp. TaxID=2782235 RepID=UPI0035A1ABD9
MTISNKVKELRLEMGLSQEKLANAVNVTRQTIISLEKGSYIPSLLLAFDLSEVFGLPIEKIFKKESMK